jgi:release factor glutamine methyltransferase
VPTRPAPEPTSSTAHGPRLEEPATRGEATPVVRSCRFGPLDVEFDDRVLTPRPWTLEQSRWAAELAADAGPGPLLELCAGAGHIGLAAAVLAGRDLVQVEASEVAAAYARVNAARAGWAGRTEVRAVRLEEALTEGERFPLVIADPPYLPTAEITLWPKDPVLAIDGGPDGLDVTRRVLQIAAGHLEPGGSLLLQTAGPGQAEAIVAVLAGPERDRPGNRVAAFTAGATRVVDPERAVLQLVATGAS